MAKIRRIEPNIPRLGGRKRVAAYARVSMETELLHHSLSAQVSHYSSLIQSNPEWEYAGVYADEGITGTSTKKRDEFNRLMKDCDAGKIDLVLVKSISRFARDTVDTLNATRHLKDLGVDVFFEREGIHSMSGEGELLLTLLAAFAQAESQSISENVKWGIRKRFKLGIPNGNKAPYGYRWNGDGFSIIPEQGEVVKEIYRRYLAGESAYSIAKKLADKGIKGQSGVPMDDSTIKNILSSISYTGTMILQKNFFTEGHKRIKNKGELPMYAVEEMFEPLVSETDFEKAQQIMKERAESMPNRNPELTAFSGRVRCANCGCSISRRTSKYGKKWVCNTKERKGKGICDFRDIYETELENAASKALNLDGFDADAVWSRVELISIDNAYIIFRLKNGTVKSVLREYKKGYSGFSSRLFCGCCGGMLEADNWKMGPAGQKKKYKVWVCRECSAQREFDSIFRMAAQALFHEEKCDGLFAQHIEKAINYDDRIDFYYKEGKVISWQKEYPQSQLRLIDLIPHL